MYPRRNCFQSGDCFSFSDLLGGYDKLNTAAQVLSGALIDLETEHLLRFSITWEDLNKHWYQATVYSDPLIQKSLPIFISQVKKSPKIGLKSLRNSKLDRLDAHIPILQQLTHHYGGLY